MQAILIGRLQGKEFYPDFDFVKQKTFMAKSFFKRQGLLSHVLARKRTRAWGRQAEPSAIGLGGKDKHVCRPGADGLLHTARLGEKDVSLH